MNGKAKKFIRNIHLWLGLASGLVVFVISIAAACFVFEEEGRELFQHDFYHVPPQMTERVSFKQMMDTVKASFPKEKIGSIRFKSTPDAAVIFLVRKTKMISVNPYTGRIIAVKRLDRDFFSVVQELHTHLLLGETGGVIIKINVLVFFCLCVSGLILWWPKQKKFLRQLLSINFKSGNWKRTNMDLHRVLGFYALLILTLISLTGMFMAYDWMKQLTAFATHSPMPEKDELARSVRLPGKKKFPLDSAYAYMQTRYPGANETYINPATDSLGVIRVIMRYPYALYRKQNTLQFDQYSGKVLRTSLYADYNAYDKVERSNYDLHTGRIHALGIGSKIIWFLVALTSASLPVTGFLIWWGRKNKKKPVARTRKTVVNQELAATT